MVMFNFDFTSYSTEVIVEETAIAGRALIKGIMLREGVSNNKNVYTIPEMKNIVSQCVGMPIYVGAATKLDTNNGMIRPNMHADFEPNRVGKIISAVFDPIKRCINYVAEIFNTASFPKMVEEIKAGWGVSIKGKADAQLIVDGSNRILYRIQNMIFKSLQLLAPHVKLGQDEARVQSVEVEETFIMDAPQSTPHAIKTHFKIELSEGTSVEIT